MLNKMNKLIIYKKNLNKKIKNTKKKLKNMNQIIKKI